MIKLFVWVAAWCVFWILAGMLVLSTDAEGDHAVEFTDPDNPVICYYATGTGKYGIVTKPDGSYYYADIPEAMDAINPDSCAGYKLTHPNTIVTVSQQFQNRIGISEHPTASVSWDAPTLNTDGSDYNDAAGYIVHYGTEPGVYPNTVDIPDPAIVSAVIENLSPGDYYFVVTAYNASYTESAYSGEVTKAVGQ